ncbi:uncharacterized protein LOC114716756 [Neltuma alba]|uniref:uncharacterized protein LOC114716756 n=1 Tax=Neltuma alba TaxID=207710 RepID=UPI0010A33401|nr:uncharacterized protein LOC114716756 [Prosopis alba]
MLFIFVTRRSESRAEALFVGKTRMATDHISMLLFFLLIHFQFYRDLHLAPALPLLAIASPPQTDVSHLLHDVLKNISARLNWNLGDVRIFELDVVEARFVTFQNYEFSIKLDKNQFGAIKFPDDFVFWRKFRKPKTDLYSLIHGVASRAVLDTLEIEGPLELRVDPPHQLSLSLPMNISHAGLKRILVGEGITLQIGRALEVSLHYSSDYDLLMDGSMTFDDEYESDYQPFMLSSTCIQLVYVRISGPTSLAAYVERSPALLVRTVSIPHDAILLLPDKHLRSASRYQKQPCPFDPVSTRLRMAEKIWRSLVGPGMLENPMSVSLEANRKASAAVKFLIGLERDVGRNYRYERRHRDEEWYNRERRRIEWVRFEVVARLGPHRLHPLSFKKSRPILHWQDVNSNESSTTWYPDRFPYFLL